jgi:hypothetical protein
MSGSAFALDYAGFGLARTLRLAAPQQRRLVILDCCFSESAAKDFMGMSGALDQAVAATAGKDFDDDQPARGTLLLCSSPVGQVSIGAPRAENTLFTGALLDVLQQGAEGGSPYLSFAELRDLAFDRMLVDYGANAPRPALHQPNQVRGDLTRVPAFLNRAAARLAEEARKTEEAGRLAEENRRAEQADRQEARRKAEEAAVIPSGPPKVSPEALGAAHAALVVHMGPIARLLVHNAAAQAVSSQDFIQRLCAHVDKRDDLATLRRRLRSEVEPRLT